MVNAPSFDKRTKYNHPSELLPSIVRKVLAEGQLAIDLIVASLRIFDSEFSILVDKALCLGLELFQCRVGPPLQCH